MRKPVYIPSIESFNEREADREEARWTRELLANMLVGASLTAVIWCLLIVTY